MQTNKKEILISRIGIDNNMIRLHTTILMLEAKRKSNYEHLKNVRNMTPEDIAKNKNMIEITENINGLKDVQDYFIDQKRELSREH